VRVYSDSAPIIYSVKQVPQYSGSVDAQLSAQNVIQVTSDLTRMECRVKPLRDGDNQLLKDFDDYFAGAVGEIVALSREVIDKATEIRAKYNFKTPDAIHLAAAVTSNCDVFLTNDHRLDRFTEIATAQRDSRSTDLLPEAMRVVAAD